MTEEFVSFQSHALFLRDLRVKKEIQVRQKFLQ